MRVAIVGGGSGAMALALAVARQQGKSQVRNIGSVTVVDSGTAKPKGKARSDMPPRELQALHRAETKRERRRLRNARIEAELGNTPEGVRKRGGVWVAECRRCGNDYELPCEVGEFDPEYSYCGGSERCIP